MKLFKIIIPLILTATAALLLTSAKKQNPKEKAQEEAIKAALTQIPQQATPAQKRKLLVFTKTNGYRHKSIGIAQQALTLLGQTTEAYNITLTQELSPFETDQLKEYDAICFLNTTGEVFLPKKYNVLDHTGKAEADKVSDRLKANLSAFIKNGGGFIGIHSATDTLYDWPEYGEMIGGYFNGHPWNHKTDVSIKVEPGQEKNPIIAHLAGQSLDFKEEIYQLKDPYDSSKYNMLLRLDPEKSNMKVQNIHRKDQDFGVAWTKSHGQGRVFYCSLGHNNDIFTDHRVLQIYLKGIQYALGDLTL